MILMVTTNVAGAMILIREFMRFAGHLVRKVYLVMLYGWILTTWMDFVVSFLTRTVSQIQNHWQRISTLMVSKQSGCLIQEFNVKMGILCMIAALKLMSEFGKQMGRLLLGRCGLGLVFSLIIHNQKFVPGGPL